MKDGELQFNKNIFGTDSNFRARFMADYNKIAELVAHCKGLGLKVVLTQGSWDLVHIGHARYFEEAKKYGDILVVGVDSDEKIRSRKGPERPVVPEEERLEMVTHLRPVDIVTLKHLDHPRWHLIKSIRPDILIAIKENYTGKELKELKKYVGKVVVIDRMATTSTSAKIRLLQIGVAKKMEQALTPKIISAVTEALMQAQNGK